MNHPRTFLSLLALILVCGVLSACLTTPKQSAPPSNASSLELFPQQDMEDPPYTIADFILTLPRSELGEVSNRARFASWVFEEGSPQPIEEQRQYLLLPGTGLDPVRHYLLLDQRHLLIYHEYMDLYPGYPATIKILRREGDIQWRDITQQAAPAWTHAPLEVKFFEKESAQPKILIKNLLNEGKQEAIFIWINTQLLPTEN